MLAASRHARRGVRSFATLQHLVGGHTVGGRLAVPVGRAIAGPQLGLVRSVRMLGTGAGSDDESVAKGKQTKGTKSRKQGQSVHSGLSGRRRRAAGNKEAPYRKTSFTMSEPPRLPHQTHYASPSESHWTPRSVRSGVIALKCGMMPEWDQWGVRHPLTVLKLENVQVLQVKTPDVHGYRALQLGAGEKKPKRVTKPLQGHFRAANVDFKERIAEFRVTEDAMLPVGTRLNARHFVPGQYVDVTGTSIGKGFQGGMKRWGFGGQPASHGVSKTHRSLGSTGQCQDPGKVWPGKKMPGRMGGKRVTTQALLVYKVDWKRDLIFVKGAVPGNAGEYIRVRDSRKKPFDAALPPPFPTYEYTEEDLALLQTWQEREFVPPMELERLRDQGQLPDAFEEEPPFELVVQPPSVDPLAYKDNEGPDI